MFLLRVIAVWMLIMTVEFIHGIIRAAYLAPYVGDFGFANRRIHRLNLILVI